MKEKFPIEGILSLLEKEEDFVFLESARCDAENYLSYVFLRPERIISTCKIDQLNSCFRKLDQALKEGRYVAGFISYEAGEAFEEKLRHRETYDFPLLWFGVYKEPLIYNHRQASLAKCSQDQKSYILKNIRANISQPSYIKAISKIKNLIAQGSTYQVNYTFKLKFSFSGSACDLYLNLRNNQSVSYAAFIKAARYFVLSFSPELFFRKTKGAILTRPMKGTAKRGKTLKEDSENAQELGSCPKNRSENVMIVDLLRNDLGKISVIGSVRVNRLFKVEKYQTLFQMTSDIESRLNLPTSAFNIFSHIFPSGSVTGAPKIETMQIIRQLEKEPRKVYTGSIGFFSPENFGIFNVAIRTLLIDTQSKSGEMGVGSGIVYDSNPRNEYGECCLKADFLTKSSKDFQLIETMLWQPHRGFLLLKQHLRRLEASARYFDFLYHQEYILQMLSRLQKTLKQNAYRVRLLLFKEGKIKLESSLIAIPDVLPKVYLAAKRMDSKNRFLYHKTTERKIYDAEYKRARQKGFYDVIFANERNEITEGAISNIFIRKKGVFYTPPLSSGLLDGVYRRHLLDSKKHTVKEKVIFIKDLISADELYLSNSVRGLVRVCFEAKGH